MATTPYEAAILQHLDAIQDLTQFSHTWFLRAVDLNESMTSIILSLDSLSLIKSVHLLARYQVDASEVSLFFIEPSVESLALDGLVNMRTIRGTDTWYKPKSLHHEIEFLVKLDFLIPTEVPKDEPLSETDENYEREYNELVEMFRVFDVEMHNEENMQTFVKRWLSPLAPGIIAEMLIPIVKGNVYVFGLKSGLVWSERAKLYLQSPPERFTPEFYFKGVLRMMSLVLRQLREAFDKALLDNLRLQSSLNKLLEQGDLTEEQGDELEEAEKQVEKLRFFLSVIEKVYTKCNQVTFKDHVCKELVENLIIKRIDQVRDLLQDFSSPTDWLPLAWTSVRRATTVLRQKVHHRC